MKSINNVLCPNIIRRSEYISDIHEHCDDIPDNIEDDLFVNFLIEDVESLLQIREEEDLEIKLDEMDDDYIEHIINFCEKYRLEDLLESLRKYYAEIVIPALKGMEDLYISYGDPVSEKIRIPSEEEVQRFMQSMSWFLNN